MKSYLYFLYISIGLSLIISCGNQEIAVNTVNGSLPISQMGTTLIHEHVFIDWTGADSTDSSTWNNDEAFEFILPYLEEVKEKGVTTILDCTPIYLGRNPQLLKRLSEATGINILTNTGYYGARENKYIPQSAFEASIEEISNVWLKEYREGLEGTGIKPGFIKISVSKNDALSNFHKKLVQAAAKTHLQTGLTIVGHTGPAEPAKAQIELLAKSGVGPEAFVWTHAQQASLKSHIEIAKMGAWVSLDGMGWMAPDSTTDSTAMTLTRYLDMIENFKEKDLLDNLLISHDAGWYTHNPKDGKQNFKPFTPIFDQVIPKLKERGFTEKDIDQILVKNPKRAYGLIVRALH